MARRPLSPHISIYRFGYTMSLSILHRLLGLVLSAGLVVFAAWLCAAAAGEESYAHLLGVLPVPVLKAGLALLVVAFVYHLANGIRHLCWDAGLGFERPQARRSAALVLVFTLLVGGLLLYLLFAAGGAAS